MNEFSGILCVLLSCLSSFPKFASKDYGPQVLSSSLIFVGQFLALVFPLWMKCWDRRPSPLPPVLIASIPEDTPGPSAAVTQRGD